MLARRPMLCLALALMAGVVAARIQPQIERHLFYAWVLLSVAALWFMLTPRLNDLSPADAIPLPYRPYIQPYPGFIAKRGINRCIIILSLAAFLFGCHRQIQWRKNLAAQKLPEKTWFEARLAALAPSRIHAGQTGRWDCAAEVLEADGKPLQPTVKVRLFGPEGPPIKRGDHIHGRVRKDSPFVLAHPGAFDYQALLERDGLVASLTLVKPRSPAKAGKKTAGPDAVPDSDYQVEPAPGLSLATRFLRLTDAVRSRAIQGTLAHGGTAAPLLAAMLYGYRKDMDRELQSAFRRVGIGHVLAISGLHVGLVIGLLAWLAGWLGWSLRLRALCCLVLALFYLALTGMQVAATRATLMAVIHLGGIACGRKSDMLNSLGAAAFLCVGVNPQAPLDVSFQLSFTAVVFIFAAMHPTRDGSAGVSREDPSEFPGRLRNRRPWWLRKAFGEIDSLARLNVATWLGLFPIIAVVFNQVNPMGLPINMVVIPAMAAVLAGGLLLPWLGWLPGLGWLLTAPCRGLEELALWSDRLPYSSFPVHPPGAGWVAVFYLFVFLFLIRGMIPREKRGRWALAALGGVAFGLAAIGVEMTRAAPPPATGRLTLLPGGGMGTLVAEAPDGSIAVLGELRRGGIGEATWLHHLRRSGKVGLVALADAHLPERKHYLAEDGKENPEADEPAAGKALAADLAYHYPLASALTLPGDRTRPGEVAGWLTVPQAEGVHYAYGRDGQGRVVWLSVRAGAVSAALARDGGWAELPKWLDRADGRLDAGLLALTWRGKSSGGGPVAAGLPFRRVAVSGFGGENYPDGWFDRRRYGALVERDGLRVFDGAKWVRLDFVSLPPPPTPID